MKPLTKASILLAISFTLIAPAILAQAPKNNQLHSREIIVDYDQGKVDGMRVIIKKDEDGQLVSVPADNVFKTGDQIKVEFESNFDGYVYILNVSPGGKTCILFPHAKETNNAIRARQRYVLPTSALLRFDEEKGIEVMQVYMSRQPITQFDESLKAAMEQGARPCLGQSAPACAA